MRCLIVIALVSCTRTSEKYCQLHPDDRVNCATSDAPRAMCMDNSMCLSPTPFCYQQSVCVGCLTSADCMAGTTCDPMMLQCRNCIEHSDCGSKACLPEAPGLCGTDDNVIYVDPNGIDSGECTFANPCKTIKFALGKLKANRFHIKLTGTVREDVVVDANKYVVFLADPGTKLISTADPSLKIVGSTVTVYDLEIACAGAGGGVRSEGTSSTTLRNMYIHNCGKEGIESKGGFLTVSHTRIAQNVEGGIITDATAKFVITNTLVYKNGGPAAPHGGVKLGAEAYVMDNRFEHNTVADNQAKGSATEVAGVTCTPGNTMAIPHNIIAGNTTATIQLNSNIAGGCNFNGSLVPLDPATVAFTADYHIGANSAARDTIDVSGVVDDIDGELRPQGGKYDHGADEYKAP